MPVKICRLINYANFEKEKEKHFRTLLWQFAYFVVSGDVDFSDHISLFLARAHAGIFSNTQIFGSNS